MSECHVREYLSFSARVPQARSRLPDSLLYPPAGHWAAAGAVRGGHWPVLGPGIGAHVASSAVLQGRQCGGENCLLAVGRLQLNAGGAGLSLCGVFNL